MDDNLSHLRYGIYSGICGTLVSHPAFVSKTFIQNNEGRMMDIIRNCQNKNMFTNLQWFYKGIIPAMCGAAGEKMMVFGTYNAITKYYKISNDDYCGLMFAGFIAGIMASLISTPAEQLAIDTRQKTISYNIMHLYNAFHWTVLRESIGFMIYLPTFEYLQNTFNSEKYIAKSLLNGSLTSIVAWTIVCPLDKLKTMKQCNSEIKFIDFVHGYRGFYFALARAIPFHATCLTVYEILRNKKV